MSKGTYSWVEITAIFLAFMLAALLLLFLGTVVAVGYLLDRYAHPVVVPEIYIVTPTPTVALPAIEGTPSIVRETPLPPSSPPPVSTRTPTPTPVGGHLPPHAGRITVAEAERVPVPTRDLRVLGMRFHPELGEIPPTVNPTPPVYHVGDERTFWATNSDDERRFQVTAVLRHITPHAYFWVEKGAEVDEDDLRDAAETFERQIYPTDRRVFGEEWEPGVDNDPHIAFFHARGLGNTIAGYFSSEDSYPRAVSPYSNEMDMFAINLDATQPGDPFYLQVIAHEFQHMIQWHQDRNEETWLNEGFSVLAEAINGYPLDFHVQSFLENPDLQLTAWSEDDAGPHYGAAGLFSYYLYERFGEDFIRRVSRHEENGMESIDLVLHEMDLAHAGHALTAQDVFGDWVVANWVNDPKAEDGIYGYRDQVEDKAAPTHEVSEYPTVLMDSVAQFGTDYILLTGEDGVTVRFQGDALAKVAPVTPHSGYYLMWGNREDESDSRLYTQVDLTHVDRASLSYWTWYDIEKNYDYAYVIVSTDGGEHWQLLSTEAMTTANPYGNNLGVGYTGKSGGGDTPRWIHETIDLSAFVGRSILIGFEYVTDDAFTRPGFFLDDVTVEGTGLKDDFEAPLTHWVQEGFIRTDTYVPQSYLVQVIQHKGHNVRVHRFVSTHGEPLTFRVSDVGWGETVIAVSGMAPLTWEAARYTVDVRR